MSRLQAFLKFLAGSSEVDHPEPMGPPARKGSSGSEGKTSPPTMNEKKGEDEPLAKQFDEIELRRRHAEVSRLEHSVKLWMAIKEQLSTLFFERGPFVAVLVVVGLALKLSYYEGSTTHHLADRLNAFVALEKADVHAERLRSEAEVAKAVREREAAQTSMEAMRRERDTALQQAAQQRGLTQGVTQALDVCNRTLVLAREGYIRQVECDTRVATYFNERCAIRR